MAFNPIAKFGCIRIDTWCPSTLNPPRRNSGQDILVKGSTYFAANQWAAHIIVTGIRPITTSTKLMAVYSITASISQLGLTFRFVNNWNHSPPKRICRSYITGKLLFKNIKKY